MTLATILQSTLFNAGTFGAMLLAVIFFAGTLTKATQDNRDNANIVSVALFMSGIAIVIASLWF